MPVRCGMQRTIALCVMAAVVMATTLVRAQTPDRTITCTGTLIDVAMRSKVWSLAVIYDAAGGYTCTVDRSGSRHDPMRPCLDGATLAALSASTAARSTPTTSSTASVRWTS